MINKILIRTSDRKTLHKDRRSLGMNGENLQEVLLFCLDEKIEGNGVVEVELPDGTKGMIEVDRTEDGYELPVKSSLLTQTGFVKFQLRILHDNVEIFKSEIIALEVKDSINATETIPEQYPTWIDNLTTLKQELEKAESERVSNEEKRQSAEETRQVNFTKMQETVSSAVSNIKDLTDKYNSNAEKETKKFNDNAVEQTKTFNDNSDSKLVEYNKKHTDKIKEYDDNSKAKLDAYNKNDTDKINAYNDNTVLKEKAYNDNAADKVKEYNTNVEQKETELEKLAEKKINEYNQVSAELTAKVEQVQAENEALKAENKLIKEQIPSATASGNSIHVEDSGTLDFDWKIRGGHKQKTREGYNLLDLSNFITQTKNGVTVVKNEDGSIKATGTNTSDSIISFDLATTNISSGDYVVSGVFGGSSSTYKMDIAEKGVRSYASSRDGAKDFTIEKDIEATAILYVYPNISINTVIYPMLYKGTDMDKPFEQYGALPSPDYPSEVETVENNVNELDIQNIIVGGLVNGNIVSNTISRLVTKEPIPVKSSIAYNINFNELGEFKGVRIGIHSLDSKGNFLKDSGWLNFSDTKQITYTTAENCKSIRIVFSFSKTAQTVTTNTEYTEKIILDDFYNMKFKLEKGSIATPYSTYGMGSVEVDVVNKNLLNIANTEETTKDGITYSIKNGILKLNGTTTSNLEIQLSKNIKIKKGKYTHSSSYIQSGLYISFDNLMCTMIRATVGKKITFELTEDTTYKRYFIWIDKGTLLNNVEIKLQLEVGDTATDFVEHQSQTAIMPIQQEMLEGDYIADVEHHEWEKIIIDTSKLIEDVTNEEGKKRYRYDYNKVIKKSDITHNVAYSNMFKLLGEGQTYWNIKGFTIVNNTIYIYDEGESLAEFISKIADKQLVFYAQLATPVDLELTSEQKAIRDTKLYTYKNITNIAVSDELASIDVEYEKDLETEHNKLQSQIDEIKQLLSTTQTSALLLDNLQKDVESEVE